jgi:hypothetical protein
VAELGSVDLLKMDCEGAEWDIFKQREPWQKVRHLAMEYHLDLGNSQNATIETVDRTLRELGFTKVTINQTANHPWGLAFARR